MNPIFERRLFLVRYAVLSALFSAAYATVFGAAADMSAVYVLLDGVVFGAAAGFGGLMLWNILKYGAEGINSALLRKVYYVTVGLMFLTVTMGVGSLAMRFASEEAFRAFAPTIPARTLCLVPVYALFALYYAYAGRGRGSDEPCGEIPVPRTAATHGGDAIERITVRAGQKIEVIRTDDIIYLQADGDYVYITTSGGRWLKEQTMKYFEENLPPESFIRIHRSYIVSVTHISRIEQSGRERLAILRDGTRIRISDSGYKLLKRTLSL